MDSPILNSFLADCFRIVDPIPKKVDWFYIEGDNVVRRFTFTTKGEGWREVTNSADPSAQDEHPAPSSDGQHFTDFQATNAVHPGHENVTPDGLRLHPVARPTPFLELEPFWNEEWDSFDSSEEFWAFFESDSDSITITSCDGEVEPLLPKEGKAGKSCKLRGKFPSAKIVGWLKGKLAKKGE